MTSPPNEPERVFRWYVERTEIDEHHTREKQREYVDYDLWVAGIGRQFGSEGQALQRLNTKEYGAYVESFDGRTRVRVMVLGRWETKGEAS